MSHTNPTENSHTFVIDLDDRGEDITIRTFKDMVSVKLNNATSERFHGALGMMGEYGTGKFMARDGTTVLEDPGAMAAEWQVKDDEPMLFQAMQFPQHPQACVMPEPKAASRRLGASSLIQESAKKACMEAGAANIEFCIRDVMATGDLDMAEASRF